MDGDEHVGAVAVGDGGTLTQLNELVGAAGIDDLHVGQVLLDVVTELQCHGQVNGLFGGQLAQGSRVLAAVTRVDDDGLYLFALLCQNT